MDLVTVVTPTIGRWPQLERALRSVAQQAGVAVEHVVVGAGIDASEWDARTTELAGRFPAARFVNLPPPAGDIDYPPARTAPLRNHGVAVARGRWIAHLDDDNEFEEDHLMTLLAALRAQAGACVAHSWRRLFHPDGSPFIVRDRNPWFDDDERARESYEELLRAGVFAPNSNVMRDRPIGPSGEEYFLIDSSELLVERALQVRIPFRMRFSEDEQAGRLAEDRAFCMDLYAAGHEIVPSRRATLRYYMGGYSNVRDEP